MLWGWAALAHPLPRADPSCTITVASMWDWEGEIGGIPVPGCSGDVRDGCVQRPVPCGSMLLGLGDVCTLHKVACGSGWGAPGRAQWVRYCRNWLRFEPPVAVGVISGLPCLGWGGLCAHPHLRTCCGWERSGGCQWRVSSVLSCLLPPDRGSRHWSSFPNLPGGRSHVDHSS